MKHLQAINPIFLTIIKPLSMTIGETFCEGLMLMSKLLEKNGREGLKKPFIVILPVNVLLKNLHWETDINSV